MVHSALLNITITVARVIEQATPQLEGIPRIKQDTAISIYKKMIIQTNVYELVIIQNYFVLIKMRIIYKEIMITPVIAFWVKCCCIYNCVVR